MPTSIDALIIFLVFFPGIIGMFAFQNGAEIRKLENFDKFALAVTLSLLAYVIGNTVFDIPIVIPDEKTGYQEVVTSAAGINAIIRTVIAVVCGLALALAHNKRVWSRVMNPITGTTRTGMMDTWHQALSHASKCWITIRYNDGDILVGYKQWYSLHGEDKALFLADATWHFQSSDKKKFKEVTVDGLGVLITNFEPIRSIELKEG